MLGRIRECSRLDKAVRSSSPCICRMRVAGRGLGRVTDAHYETFGRFGPLLELDRGIWLDFQGRRVENV